MFKAVIHDPAVYFIGEDEEIMRPGNLSNLHQIGFAENAARSRYVPGDGRPRLGQTCCRSVVGEAIIESFFRCLFDVCRSIEIRLADLKMDNVLTLRLEGSRF